MTAAWSAFTHMQYTCIQHCSTHAPSTAVQMHPALLYTCIEHRHPLQTWCAHILTSYLTSSAATTRPKETHIFCCTKLAKPNALKHTPFADTSARAGAVRGQTHLEHGLTHRLGLGPPLSRPPLADAPRKCIHVSAASLAALPSRAAEGRTETKLQGSLPAPCSSRDDLSRDSQQALSSCAPNRPAL